jgi:hypothetical protein
MTEHFYALLEVEELLNARHQVLLEDDEADSTVTTHTPGNTRVFWFCSGVIIGHHLPGDV